MNNLCIIPARGGSKRIPRKNIKDFSGNPIIAYSIEAAIKSKLFDEIMVSTEDEEIAAVAKKYGASVPFIRSAETSGDFATTSDVLMEVINNYHLLNKDFSLACCIYPTAPFITVENLISAFELLKVNNLDSVFPVVKFSYPIQRALRLNNGKISMFQPENLNKRSQDLEPAYHDAGQFYWFDVSKFMIEKKLFMSNSGAIILDESNVQDIDTETDWQLAQIKFQLSEKSKK